MREVVTIHAGQCGNQIGAAFWDLLLLEHENTIDNDPALSSFFYFSTIRNKLQMKARALLVDMECGPLQEVMRGGLGNLFDETQYIMDVSGAGNNFAHGYYHYGPIYHDRICEGVRRNVERCDSLQAFSLIHSLGGGTGSGVGTFILQLLADEYNKVTRFSTCIYPSAENDVITSPYNTILATSELINSADCVFPLNNSSLFTFYQNENPTFRDNLQVDEKDRGFNRINLIAARMLCSVTSSSRFSGEMNVDLNEIYTNLVPFPKLHFISSALNIRNSQKARFDISKSALQRAFGDVLGMRGQLSGSLDYGSSTMTTASAFIGRGKIILSEFLQCISAAQQTLHFPSWNKGACKVGVCGTAIPGDEMSVLGLYNSSAFSAPLERELQHFQKLFRVKAMLHHYTEYVDEAVVKAAESEVSQLITSYKNLEKHQSVVSQGASLFPSF